MRTPPHPAKGLTVGVSVPGEALAYADSIINTIREPLLVLDSNLRVVSTNRSFYTTFLVNPEETVGRMVYELGNHQWDIPALRELLERILPEKESFSDYEVSHAFPTLGMRTMLLNARQLRRGFGLPPLILLAIEDITRRKRLEVELERTLKELDGFAYSVSHDLKAPLRGIGQVVDWLQEELADKLNDDQTENMDLMRARVGRMSDLIDGLLRSARLGRTGEVREMVNLQKLVADVVDSIQPPKSIAIEVEGVLPTISCVLIQIEQVFQNLISNAVRYMDKEVGRVKIGARESSFEWTFFVEDNGPGIPKEHFDRIFQIFQTLHPRDEVESTGIGLSIVKKVVELHHGHVWLESEVGKGSTFFFSIPKNGHTPEGKIL